MAGQVAGKVVAVWRYPIKSMMGEELNAAELTSAGLVGDRGFAVFDGETGKKLRAKEWPKLFEFRAAYVEPPQMGRALPAVRITFPDGSTVLSDASEIDAALSRELGRAVVLRASEPPGMFFDDAPVHLLTTSTLDHLRSLYPAGRFETRRFRPNLVLQLAAGAAGFVENGWPGGSLAIGANAKLNVTLRCVRCVMTTMPQGDLPHDDGILKTAAQHNQAEVGVYATVAAAGRVKRGDPVTLAEQTLHVGR